eukprot:9821291-Alexandrium_andersonii.AAC.1
MGVHVTGNVLRPEALWVHIHKQAYSICAPNMPGMTEQRPQGRTPIGRVGQNNCSRRAGGHDALPDNGLSGKR